MTAQPDTLPLLAADSTELILVSAQQSGPQYSIEDIDPETAKGLLGGNTRNRNLRARVVDSYAADMKAGAWQENGESIKIATDGTLIDGQHRLHAVVDSGTTQRMLVVRGLPMETQDVVDTGAKRSFADVLKLRKEPCPITVASVTRRVHMWQRGFHTTNGNYVPTNTQLLATLNEHPDIRWSAEIAETLRKHASIHGSVLGLCHWLFTHLPAETLDERTQLNEDVKWFFERLRDGDSLAVNHPIAVMRRTAVNNMTSKSRINETVMAAYLIKAWNAYREGRAISLLQYRQGGASPEKFPEPK